MARYLDRLVERAAGSASALPTFVRTPPLAATRTDDVDELAPAPRSAVPDAAVPPGSTTIVERHLVSTDAAPPPVVISQPAPASVARELVHTSTPPAVAAAASPPVPSVVDTLPPVPVASTQLRAPEPQAPTETDRWLAPASPVPEAKAVDAPRAAPAVVPTPVVAPTPRSVAPQAPHVAAPAVDDRPALTIGRLLVEVRSQPPAPPAAPTIIHTTAPAAPAPVASVVDRSFGLGQS